MPLIAEHELYRRLVAARPAAATPVGHATPAKAVKATKAVILGRVGEAVEAALAADRHRWPHLDVGLTCLLDPPYVLVCGDICAAVQALGDAGYGHVLTRAGAVAADLADALEAASLRPDVRLMPPSGLNHLTTVAIADPARAG